ncbi:MAG: hypothetical protein MJ248_03735 [Bacilli bacterium]|nr:hypothetical protein [Bacilli bacterium]
MARFKKYNGPDKYHFRVYKVSIGHPCLIVAVKEEKLDGKIYLDGYLITHSFERFLDKPNVYIQLHTNPNSKDDRTCFINRHKIRNIPSSRFSKPYSSWHLSKIDEKLIDDLEAKNK